MRSLIATVAGRKTFMRMARNAVKKAIDFANAKSLPQAYDDLHHDKLKRQSRSKQFKK